MPPLPNRTGPIYQRRPRPPLSSGEALLAWVWSHLVLAWNTLVDGVLLLATMLFLSDPHTLFKRADGGSSKSHRHMRFLHRSLSLDDVKLVKTAMNCVRVKLLNIYINPKSNDANYRQSKKIYSGYKNPMPIDDIA
jgi:hypothetical protein